MSLILETAEDGGEDVERGGVTDHGRVADVRQDVLLAETQVCHLRHSLSYPLSDQQTLSLSSVWRSGRFVDFAFAISEDAFCFHPLLKLQTPSSIAPPLGGGIT